jgi:hypothetical protein
MDRKLKATELRQYKFAIAVKEAIERGEKPDLKELAFKSGYRKNNSKINVSQITNGKTFQEVLKQNNEKASSLMDQERERALLRLKGKIDSASYRDLAYVIDILTKNRQLLTGGATDNINMKSSIIMLPSKENYGSTEPQNSEQVKDEPAG